MTALWHISICVHPPIPTKAWTAGEFQLAGKIARAWLKGVGNPELRHFQAGDVAVHYRVPMTAEEAGKLRRHPDDKRERVSV